MKYHSALFAAVAALVLGSQAVHAEDAEKEKPARSINKERIMEKYDTNKDGALSKEELAAAPDRVSKTMLEKGDTNKDGALSKDEVEAIKSDRKEHSKKDDDKKDN